MAIDRKKIIDDLSQLELNSDENGIIEGFNVLVTQMPAKFWNTFADRLTHKVEPELLEATEYLLYNAAHECAYHTGHGIITSEEWNAAVEPMIERVPEDILYGAYAVVAAWGWADAEIIELIPDEKLVVRAYNYYEADVVRYGHSSKMSAYKLTAVCAAFMELAYAGEYDPEGKPVGTFVGKQLKGIECGDPYGEFVATRA